MPVTKEAVLPDLTPEQDALLKARYAKEFGVNLDAQGRPSVDTDLGPESAEDFVFTNMLNADLMIPDLGIKTPDGGFEPHSFKPNETVNLRTVYKRREITASKYLQICIRDGKIVKGKPSIEQTNRAEDPLVTKVKSNMGQEGAFSDPFPLTVHEDRKSVV